MVWYHIISAYEKKKKFIFPTLTEHFVALNQSLSCGNLLVAVLNKVSKFLFT